MDAAKRYLIGVDVGTGSARAGVFSSDGTMLASARRDIAIYREPGAIVEQSSRDIWQAVCAAVREAVTEAAVAPGSIAGLAFDATCSLVVLGPGGEPLAVGPSDDPDRNIIVWMDHRAVSQAEQINAIGHPVLAYVGGTISPEMETPKLLWLKQNRRKTFDAAWQFLDLADFLSWRSTGSLVRSSCTVTCKWTYLAHEARWDGSYFDAIGLGELAAEGFARIGTDIVAPGTLLAGLTREAAAELGLAAGTPVGAGLIDAHAGGVGTAGAIGAVAENLAYVFGTSSCTMTTTAEPVFVPGVWGPYFSAMTEGAWLLEGGQSAAGAAIDRLLAMHPAVAAATQAARAQAMSLPQWLARAAEQAAGTASQAIALAQDLHVVPEFLGNRAPFADPHARAVIAGLGMEQDETSLAGLYVAGVCSIGYGLRQIVETQAAHGVGVQRIVISGGAGQDDLVRQLLADATGLPVIATRGAEPVLLGSAILASIAGTIHADMTTAIRAMSHADRTYEPAGGAIAALHAGRFAAFAKLQDVAREIGGR